MSYIVSKWQVFYEVILLFNCVRFINLENEKMFYVSKKSIAQLRLLFSRYLFFFFFPLSVFLISTGRLSTQDPATKPQNIFLFVGLSISFASVFLNTFRAHKSKAAARKTYVEIKKFLVLDYLGLVFFFLLTLFYNI